MLGSRNCLCEASTGHNGDGDGEVDVGDVDDADEDDEYGDIVVNDFGVGADGGAVALRSMDPAILGVRWKLA